MRTNALVAASAALILVATGGALAVGASGGGERIAPPIEEPDAEQQAADQARTQRADEQRSARSNAVDDPQLEREFAIFRRPAQSGDSAPSAQGAEISRRARADNGVSMFLYRNGDELCVQWMGLACGMADQATDDPLVVATSKTDGSETQVAGPVADSIAAVELTTTDGTTTTVQPGQNVFAAELPGRLAEVVLVHRDGTRQQAVK